MKKGKWILLIVMILLMPTLVFVAFKDKETKVTDTPKITYNTYVELDDDFGTYVKYDGDDWPDEVKYVLNTNESICTGLDGRPAEAYISYEDGEVVVETLSSVNCDIYFNTRIPR